MRRYLCVVQPSTQSVYQRAVRDIRMAYAVAGYPSRIAVSVRESTHKTKKKTRRLIVQCRTWPSEMSASADAFPIIYLFPAKYLPTVCMNSIDRMFEDWTLQFGPTVHFLQEATIFTA